MIILFHQREIRANALKTAVSFQERMRPSHTVCQKKNGRLTMKKSLGAVMGLACSLVLAGCSSFTDAEQTIKSTTGDVSTQFERSKAPAPARKISSVTFNDSVYLGSKSFKNSHGDSFPAFLEKSDGVVLNSFGQELSFDEITSEIYLQTRLPISKEIQDDSETSGNGGSSTLPGLSGAGGNALSTKKMPVMWQGSLSGLLDAVCLFYDLSWEYRNGTIRIYDYETRTFAIAALPIDSDTTSSLEGGGNGAAAGGSTSGVSVTTNNTAQIQIWEEIRENLESLIPEDGGRVSMARSTGTITVVTRPGTMERIARYIKDINDRLTSQVVVSVKVMRVALNDDFQLGMDINLLLASALGQVDLNFSGPNPAQNTSGSSFASTIINRPGGTGVVDGDYTSWNGTTIVVDALKSLGNVSLVTEASVTTLNGRPAPLSVSRKLSYVKEISKTVDNGVTTTSMTPDVLDTGFNMGLLPRILDDGRVLLQYGIGLSDLRELTTFTDTNGNSVQLPDLDSRNFLQQSVLNSGDLLVLAGYQQEETRTDDTGLPFIGMLLGGSKTASSSRSAIVLVITPQVLETGAVR
ncbi:MAG TPA: PilN family type IVB pilus formation outer membrane protein [Rhodospirillaceae bacterium]|nr:PilN family type IVB pilus formation outer membrane protein [Rhodospirillaceae bacterium]